MKEKLNMIDGYRRAMKIAISLLEGVSNPSQEDIRKYVELSIQTVKLARNTEEIDVEQLIREIESLVTVTIGDGSILEDKSNHLEWLHNKKADINWKFWNRYQKYLETVELLPQSTSERLDVVTDEILERLEDPQRQAPWDTRGMVVGRVQSGKTSNYIGLICKAIDSGYKVVIILAGIHNSLRSQTQLRIDEGVLGYDTQVSRSAQNQFQKIGVGLLPDKEPPIIHSLTSSANNGDFSRTVAQQVGGMFGGDPFILVIKKNARVLENIKRWALSVKSDPDPITNKPIIRNIPLLMIDDEADNASINTRAIPTDENGNPLPEYEVTAINKKIRELLSIFNKSAYIGYTATPFANIYIPYDANTESLEDDIFPRNFIINLPTPSNYIGPAELFGIKYPKEDEEYPLPIIREVLDNEKTFPPKHKKDLVPNFLPESLIKAIRSFVLVCAARCSVGKSTDHNSMLIHVTRYIDVQAHVADLVRSELISIRRRLEYTDGNSQDKIIEELRSLWNSDFEPTTKKMRENEKTMKMNLLETNWDKVEKSLFPAISKTVIRTLNGSAKDTLDYEEHKTNGLSVIAVGGDKLSRGLTLYGLSVSYYLRTSKMYDTLMQMGRWFGYRPGYLNLCRLYTTPQLIDWYRYVTFASEELLEEFNIMAQNGETPKQYGLKIRAHPDGMVITAMSKMRSGKKRQIGYDGEIAELAYYPTDSLTYDTDNQLTVQFISSLSKPDQNGNLIWKNVSGKMVSDYIENFKTIPLAIKANSKSLATYIKKQIAKNELVNWTVALMSNKQADQNMIQVGEYIIGKSTRAATHYKLGENNGAYMIGQRRLITPSHEYLDFSASMKEAAMKLGTDKNGKEPTPEAIRKTRDPKNGLILIYYLNLNVDGKKHNNSMLVPAVGFAISFPSSTTAEKIEYVVNLVEDDKYDDE